MKSNEKAKGFFFREVRRARKIRDKRCFFLGVIAGCIGCATFSTTLGKLGKLVSKLYK